MKTQWSQFDATIRAKALAHLHTKGVYCWQSGFDQNSESVIAVCRAIEENRDLVVPIKADYVWNEDMQARHIQRLIRGG